MIRTCDELYQRPIHAVDGELGKVFDLYVDGFSWHIRYVVAELGSWFKSRRVLLSPLALAEYDGGPLKVHLTKQEIADCPGNGQDKPVSLQEQERVDPLFTMARSYSATGGLGMVLPFVPPVNGDELRIDDRWNRRLRSIRIIRRYALCTDEGKAGQAKDFLIDDRSWTIKYLVFSPAGQHYKIQRLIDAQKISSIEWSGECMNLETSRKSLLRLPAFDQERHVNISYEELLNQLASPARNAGIQGRIGEP
jgi:hypothetical protein